MEFISAEEFLKQPKEIQQVFIEWWKPSIGDLATNRHSDLSVLKENRDIEAVKIYKGKPYAIPLFTEGQLRKFIEDNGYFISNDIVFKSYTLFDAKKYKCCKVGEQREDTILKTYWKVACEIAKESVENE